MKKIILIILVLCSMAALIACGVKKNNEAANKDNVIVETENMEETVNEEEKEEAEENETTEESQKETETSKGEKPVVKPENEAQKETETKPQEKPVEESEKEPENTDMTLGNTLLAEFKEKASEGVTAEKIAQELLENSAIEFEGGVMSVEEGLLTGFDNAEIKGFKEGVMFSPMISSIPFIGYIFELEEASETASFVTELKKNANLRWNLCVEAEEMITGIKDNKVFFVMCPKNLQEQ